MKRKKQVMAGGYGIMPNKILFDKKLSSTAKLLYSFINSLCAEKGHCFASNKYLAEKFNLSESRISKSLSQLDPYLTFTDRNSDKRKIYIYDINLVENNQVPSRKQPGNLGENDIHNNISEKDKTNKITLPNGNVENPKNNSKALIGSDPINEHSAAAGFDRPTELKKMIEGYTGKSGELIKPQKHIAVIGLLIMAQKIEIESKEQLASVIARNARAAKLLAPYSLGKVLNTMKYLHENADYKWGLETVGKYIDQDLTKIKEIKKREVLNV